MTLSTVRWSLFVLMTGATLALATGASAAAKKKQKVEAPPKRVQALAFVAYPKAQSAPPRLLSAMGLDAFTDYKIDLQLTNDEVRKVAEFYVKALGRVPRKETSDTGTAYTFMVGEPTDANPLGNKVVIEEKAEGTPDVSGAKWRVTITGYWKKK